MFCPLQTWGSMLVAPMDLFSIYSRNNRTTFLIAAALLIVLLATIDWLTKPYISIGFLYLFPIMLIAAFLPRWQTTIVALACAVLQEVFSNLPSNEAITRLVMASAGFVGTGMFVSELIRNRQIALEHIEEVEAHNKFRQDAEEQLRILVESSPAAIVTIDASGRILLANQAAQNLFAPGDSVLAGQSIAEFLPALQSAVQTQGSRQFRTELRCHGKTARPSWRRSGFPPTPPVRGAAWPRSSSTSPKISATVRI